MLKLRYHSADNGFCRVYYKADGRKTLYCMQIEGPRFELLTCSRDGEPDCPLRPGFVESIEMPKGDESIEVALHRFLEQTPVDQINAEYA